MNNKNDEDIQPLTPEEIKAIGEIEIGPTRHEIFLNKHYKKLIAGGIVFLLAASGAICYATYRQQEEEQASAALVSSMKLQTPGSVASPDAYDAAVLTDIQNQHGKTPSASTAALMAALAQLNTEEGRSAGLAQLETIAEQSPSDLIRARAHAALAAHYMSEGVDDKAIAHWKAVAGLPANPYTVVALISLGDLAKNAGDTESARSYYKQAELQHPASPLTRSGVVELRSMLLEVDNPKPLAPPQAVPPAPTTFGTSITPAAPAGSTAPFGTPGTPGTPGTTIPGTTAPAVPTPSTLPETTTLPTTTH